MPKAEAKSVPGGAGRPGDGVPCAPGEGPTAPPPPSIWERLDAMPRGPRTTLTHQQIAEAAVGLADAEGLAAVSMRRLAEELGVATMALYRYVANKDELLELMVDAVPAREPLRAPAVPGDWRTVFRMNGRRVRETTLAHPWLVEAQALVPHVLTPSRIETVETMLAVFSGLGLDRDTQMVILRAVHAYTKGAVEAEVNQRQLMVRRGFGADGDVRLLLRSNMHWMLNSGRFPHFTDMVRAGLRPPDPEVEFESGLECLLDGLAARYGI